MNPTQNTLARWAGWTMLLAALSPPVLKAQQPETTKPSASSQADREQKAGPLMAKEPRNDKQSSRPVPAGKKPSEPLERGRDPFTLDPALAAAAARQGKLLPPVVLRGWLESVQGARIALLQVGNEVPLLVRPGDRFTLRHQGRRWPVVVQRIDPGTVVLQLQPQGPVLTVR